MINRIFVISIKNFIVINKIALVIDEKFIVTTKGAKRKKTARSTCGYGRALRCLDACLLSGNLRRKLVRAPGRGVPAVCHKHTGTP